MKEEIKSFVDLEAYKACREYRIFIHRTIVPIILTAKEFDLANQIKRSSRSITANIAEEYGRFHYMDKSKFCGISRGSLYETLEHCITAQDELLITTELPQQSRQPFEKSDSASQWLHELPIPSRRQIKVTSPYKN